jgi:hypothetical protein
MRLVKPALRVLPAFRFLWTGLRSSGSVATESWPEIKVLFAVRRELAVINNDTTQSN